MEIEAKTLEELDPAKIYHIKVSADSPQENLRALASAIQALGLKALITKETVTVETLAELFGKLPQQAKDELFNILSERPKFSIDEPPRKGRLELDWTDFAMPENAVNPVKHEQAK